MDNLDEKINEILKYLHESKDKNPARTDFYYGVLNVITAAVVMALGLFMFNINATIEANKVMREKEITRIDAEIETILTDNDKILRAIDYNFNNLNNDNKNLIKVVDYSSIYKTRSGNLSK